MFVNRGVEVQAIAQTCYSRYLSESDWGGRIGEGQHRSSSLKECEAHAAAIQLSGILSDDEWAPVGTSSRI